MDKIVFPAHVNPFVPTPTDTDVPAKTVLITRVNALEGENGYPASTEEAVFETNGGDFNSNPVPPGSSGSVSACFIDKAGNRGPECPPAAFTNASDTTPPPAPDSPVTLGNGQTVTV